MVAMNAEDKKSMTQHCNHENSDSHVVEVLVEQYGMDQDQSTSHASETDASDSNVAPIDSSSPLVELTPLRTAEEWKGHGNAYFTAKQFAQALQAYEKALQLLPDREDTSSLAISLHSNRSLVLLKLRQFLQAEEAASKVLKMEPSNIKALLRRANSREGRLQESRKSGNNHFDSGSTSNTNVVGSSEFLLPALDDLQKALGLLDKERLGQDESTPEIDKKLNQNLTQDCQRALDRLEKELRLLSRREDRKQSRLRGAFTSSRKAEKSDSGVKRSTSTSPSPRQRPRPEEAIPTGLNGVAPNGTSRQSSSVHLPPSTCAVSATQQRKDVLRLLLARQSMLESSNKNRANGSDSDKLSASPEGEAFFLLEWNWWVHWCHYVDLFQRQILKHEIGNHGDGMDDLSDRVQQILNLLPPGAVLPDHPRTGPKKNDSISDAMSEEDDDSYEDGIIQPPGPIDNSVLLIKSSDRYYQQWYKYINANDDDDPPHVELKRNLVRGYHYDLVPREVYSALRSWYGERTPPLCRRTTREHNIILYPRPASGLRIMTSGNERPRCSACRAPGAIKKCKHCMSVQYCDRSCQESHWRFHKVYCKAIQDATLDDGRNAAVHADAILPRDSNGKVGLNQLGNTCFMNSAIQSLSHATPLTRFFLSSHFEADLNCDNPLGTGGKLARAYDVVMKALWMKPGIRATSPIELKRAIAHFAPRFAGCLQHDAQEFLAYLLDGLHEDLNRIRKAPYVELPDVTNGDNMAVASAEAWDAHKRRNDSLVLDTFYGQFQSTCICPKCNRVSVAFDAFNHVSLEIPRPAQYMSTSISVCVYFPDGTKKPVRYGVTLPLRAPILDLRERIAQLSQLPPADLVLAGVEDHRVSTLFDDKNLVSSIDTRRCNVIAYALAPIEDPRFLQAVVSHSFCMLDDVDSMEMKTNVSPEDDPAHKEPQRRAFGIPFMTSIPKDRTCRDLYRHIWKLVRRMIVTPPIAAQFDETVDQAIDASGKYRPKDVLTIRITDYQGRPLDIVRTEDGNSTAIFPIDSDLSFEECLVDDCINSFLFLTLEWDSPKTCEKPLIDVSRFVEIDDHPSFIEAVRQKQESHQIGTKSVTLDQCFASFSQPERLDERNMWYCSKCKDHVRALKTIKLWRLPNILIVHLKRFEYSHGFRRDKLDTFVNFPLHNLDMSRHVSHWRSASEADKPFVDNTVSLQYDLFAVVNHYGRMGFGHYTAFAMSWDETGVSEDWSLFDDSSVQPVRPGEVRTAAAYILFYRRREFN